MDKQVNIHDAKTNLSKLVDEVEAGASVILARAGRPVARIVPLLPTKAIRFGLMKGKIRLGPEFDAPLPFGFDLAGERKR
jgi:prevent-host-death family protein